MSLFAPSNITPSELGAVGNGTVDATQDLTVSWKVNGNSAMTAFQIVIYKNDTDSTQIYSTGQITNNCPFYGTNYEGDPEFFSYTISASTLNSAGFTNGNQYKLIITQWWSTNEYVTQPSASVFYAKATPTLTINSLPNPITQRDYTFSAAYQQAQGDALNWIRWQIANASNTEQPFYDTEKIYGTAQLQTYYDGFFTNSQYAIRCIIQTTSGIEVDTGWVTFNVEYSTTSMTGLVEATKAPNHKNAVYVTWDGIRHIYGVATGEYSINNNILNLPLESSIIWDEVTGNPMDIPTPWNIIYEGTLCSMDAELFAITTSNGILSLTYDYSTRTLSLLNNSNVLQTLTGVRYDDSLIIIITPSNIYIRRNELTGGLFPNSTLYPNTTLYPQGSSTETIIKNQLTFTYTQNDISQIQISGGQQCLFLQIVNGVLSEDLINEIFENGNYVPTEISGTFFLTDFSKGLNAGSIYIGDDTVEGWAIYRQQGNNQLLKHIADLPLNADTILDYSAKSQQGPYTYYIFPMGPNTYITDPLISNQINPCFWNWSVLECEETSSNIYMLINEYAFGKNLTSGAISNNNSPTISQNMTQYPTVLMSQVNYKSGTLSSLIGIINYKTDNSYSDTLELRDAIYNLSTNTNTLFLKNRKGDLFEIKISSSISMTTSDNTKEQMQTVSLPWVETNNAENISIYSISEE